MKRFLSKSLFFLFPIIVLYILLEFQLDQIPTNYSIKKTFFETQIQDIEILIMGSSHGNSINPEFLDHKGFNLFNDAQDLYYDTRIIKKYWDQMPNLKLIVIPISYWTLDYRMDRSVFIDRAPFYKFKFDINPQSAFDFLYPGFFSYTYAYGWSRTVALLKNNFADSVKQKMHENGWREVGFTSIDDSYQVKRQGKLEVLFDEQLVMKKENNPGNKILLSQLIEDCRKRNIKVLFITTPVHNFYYDAIDQKKYQEMQHDIKLIANHFDLKYFDFLKDPRFLTSDFYNVDHLNDHGVEKFSRIMNEIVNEVLD